jgi:hypothetical protein
MGFILTDAILSFQCLHNLTEIGLLVKTLQQKWKRKMKMNLTQKNQTRER